ncbi:MAG: hypothetical protein ACLSCV_09750 [Acutalibacteraceae bacterium]
MFTNVPLKIQYQGELELRGEGVISWKNFEKINDALLWKTDMRIP